MGAITPIGLGVEEFWNACKEGKCGIGPITYYDTTDFKAKLAAQVKDFDPAKYMDAKQARRMEQFAQFAVAASKEAIEDAGLDMEKEDPYRVGTAIGSGIGSLQAMEREYDKMVNKGPKSCSSSIGSADDFEYGIGKCSHSIWLKGKEH